MSNREKVVVSIMVMAIGYAVYALWLMPGPERTLKPRDRTNVTRELQGRLNRELSKLGLTGVEQRIIKLARQPWEPDPFLVRLPVVAKKENPADEPAAKADDRGLKYTGYIEVGKNHMAIINDMEYEVNDEVENTPYVVKRIESDGVTLQDKDNKESFRIPFSEDVFVSANGGMEKGPSR